MFVCLLWQDNRSENINSIQHLKYMIVWLNHISLDWTSCELQNVMKNTNWSRKATRGHQQDNEKNQWEIIAIVFLASGFALWFYGSECRAPVKCTLLASFNLLQPSLLLSLKWFSLLQCCGDYWSFDDKGNHLAQTEKKKVGTCIRTCHPGQQREIFSIYKKIIDVAGVQNLLRIISQCCWIDHCLGGWENCSAST